MNMDAATIKARLLAEVEQDKKCIATQISLIEAELMSIAEAARQARNLPLEDRYRKMTLEYFLKKNELARKEIEEYVDVQLGNTCMLYEHMAQLSQSPVAMPSPHVPFDLLYLLNYKYRYRTSRIDNYDPDCLLEIDYRFMSLPAPTYRECIWQVREWYKDRETSSHFHAFAESYIEAVTAPAMIASSQDNSFISKKSELVEHIIERFHSRDYISLAHILPSFIEGILQDVCESIGLPAVKYEKASLTEVLKKIQEQSNPIGIEYLLFIFPIRRNRIAHGRELGESYQSIALSFMLDLDLLMDVAKHRDLPLNELLAILRNPSVKKIKKSSRSKLPSCMRGLPTNALN